MPVAVRPEQVAPRSTGTPHPLLRHALGRGYAGFALLDRLLLHRLATGPRPAAEVVRAWRLLVASGGSLRSAGSRPRSAGATST